MTTYRIKDWFVHFENNRTRRMKFLGWIPIPTKHDGDGYSELLEHENGTAHYGAWVALVAVAAKCNPRGTLVRDGMNAHDPESLSRKTRIPAAVFREAMPRLVRIGWLEIVDGTVDVPIPPEPADDLCTDSAPEVHDQCTDSAPTVHLNRRIEEGNGIETNGTELNGTEEERAPPPADEIPEKLRTPEFLSAWGDFKRHRVEKRSKLTPTAENRALLKLASLGPARAVAALEHSIANGWSGIFEPKAGGGKSAPSEFSGIQAFVEKRRGANGKL